MGIPWGSTVIGFEAHDWPAREVLLRLVGMEPGPTRLIKDEQDGRSQLVSGDYSRDYWRWSMKCQPNEAWCFINVSAIPDKVVRIAESYSR